MFTSRRLITSYLCSVLRSEYGFYLHIYLWYVYTRLCMFFYVFLKSFCILQSMCLGQRAPSSIHHCFSPCFRPEFDIFISVVDYLWWTVSQLPQLLTPTYHAITGALGLQRCTAVLGHNIGS